MVDVDAIRETVAEGSEWLLPSFEQSNGGFDLPDEGYYKFKFTEVGAPEPVLPEFDPSGTKKRALFSFEIQPIGDGDNDPNIGMVVKKWFTISLNERSSLYPFVKAMKGGKIDPAERINPKNLIGSTFMGVITHEEKNDGRKFPVIGSPTVDKNAKVPF